MDAVESEGKVNSEVIQGDTLHIWCEPFGTPVVSAKRGSGRIVVHIVVGECSTDEASSIASAIVKSVRFADAEESEGE